MSQKIIIFDLDGTLADIRHRRHFVEDPAKHIQGNYSFDPGIPYPKLYTDDAVQASDWMRDFKIKGAQQFYADLEKTKWKPDWDAFHKACVYDKPNEPIINIFNHLVTSEWDGGYEVKVWSGRDDILRTETLNWLFAYTDFEEYPENGATNPVELRMRPHGDHCPDTELKKRWLDEVGKENVLMVFDDRDRLVKMWRDEGITCLQVAEGNF